MEEIWIFNDPQKCGTMAFGFVLDFFGGIGLPPISSHKLEKEMFLTNEDLA
jgi:hypothetical protein